MNEEQTKDTVIELMTTHGLPKFISLCSDACQILSDEYYDKSNKAIRAHEKRSAYNQCQNWEAASHGIARCLDRSDN